jgi:hypothetical protein
MTIEEFGQQVKAKYPQYQTYSDAEIGQKMVEKYPQYQQQITQPSQAPAQSNYQQKRGVLQKVAGFLGIEKAGQATATALRSPQELNQSGNDAFQAFQNQQHIIDAMRKLPVGSPERNHLAEFLKHGMNDAPVTQEEIDPGTKLSNKEVIGSFANIGLNVATPSAFKGGLAAQVAKNAAIGAGFGAAGGLNDNKNLKGIIGSTAVGAGLGAAIPLAGAAVSKIKEKLTTVVPEYLMNHAVKPTLDELRKNIKYGSSTLGKELVQEGAKGSATGLLKISDRELTSNEAQLQKILTDSTATIKREELAKYLKPAIKKLQNTPGAAKEATKFTDVLSEFPEEVSLAQANEMKRNIYNELRDVAYRIDPSLSKTKEAMKVLASGIKTEIENKSGNPELVRGLNKKLSIYGRLEDRVVDQLARSNRKAMVSLRDTILGAEGFTHPLAFAALIGEKTAGSTRALTNAAVGLSKMKNVGSGRVAQVAKNVAKRTVLNLP